MKTCTVYLGNMCMWENLLVIYKDEVFLPFQSLKVDCPWWKHILVECSFNNKSVFFFTTSVRRISGLRESLLLIIFSNNFDNRDRKCLASPEVSGQLKSCGHTNSDEETLNYKKSSFLGHRRQIQKILLWFKLKSVLFFSSYVFLCEFYGFQSYLCL